jgi:hypothetical protein
MRKYSRNTKEIKGFIILIFMNEYIKSIHEYSVKRYHKLVQKKLASRYEKKFVGVLKKKSNSIEFKLNLSKKMPLKNKK